MSCTSMGLIGQIIDRWTPAIVRGGDGFLTFQVVYKDSLTPYSMSAFSGATAFLPAASGGVLPFDGTLQSADLGTIRVPLAASATSSLSSGDDQTIQLNFSDAQGLSVLLLQQAISIVDPLYP